MKDIVCKFGGSSLADSDKIKNVANIIKSKKRRFVVVSAPGKRDKCDIKITDSLIAMYNLAKENKSFDKELQTVRQRFDEIQNELNVDIDLDKIFAIIEQNLLISPSYDYILSRGEYINALLISKYLNFTFLDAVEFIRFEGGEVNLEKSRELLLSKINDKDSYIIPGFYGLDERGEVKTFSRGGSDITGAILSALLNSEVYENYTDVDGVMSIDPRLSTSAKVVPKLSYSEIRSLSFSGACVLHPDCVNFLKENNITLNLLNTFNATTKGSEIMSDKKINNNGISSMSSQGGYNILYIKKFSIHSSISDLENILSILKNNGVYVTQIHFGIDTVSIITPNIENERKIFLDIKDNVNVEIIKLIKDISILSIVGRGLLTNKNLEKKVINTIYDTVEKVYTISRSYDVPSIMITIPTKNMNKTTTALHENLFE